MALSALGTVSRGVGAAAVYVGSGVYKVASRVFSGSRALWSQMSLRARISLVVAIPVVVVVALYIKKKWSGNPLGGGGLPPLGALPPEERRRAEADRRVAVIEARRVAAEAERIRLAALPAPPPAVVAAPPPPAPRVRAEPARLAAEAAERRLLAGRVEPLVVPPAPVVRPAVPAAPAPEEAAAALVEAPRAAPAPDEAPPVLVEAPRAAAAEAAPDQRVALLAVASLVYVSVLPVVLSVAISQMVRIEGEEVARILLQNKRILEAADQSDILEDIQILSTRAEELSEAAQTTRFQTLASVCRTIQHNPALLRPNSKALQIANYAKCVMSVQLGRTYVAHALSRACSLAASESPDLNLDRSVQRIYGVLRLAQRTLTEAQELAGWPDPEVAVVSSLPDIRELVRTLEQEVNHAKQVLQVRLPQKVAIIRGVES